MMNAAALDKQISGCVKNLFGDYECDPLFPPEGEAACGERPLTHIHFPTVSCLEKTMHFFGFSPIF